MVKRRYFIAAIFLLCVFFAARIVSPASALNYLFTVEKEVVHVYWNDDGTLSLDYAWSFANSVGAHPIDFVDVGLPNSHFEISAVQAEVDGYQVPVSLSEYQGSGTGFAVIMGAKAIPAGDKGLVHVVVRRIGQVLYADREDPNYASAQFSPTWFGQQYVQGTTDLTIVFHLPATVKTAEARYQSDLVWDAEKTPDIARDANGLITYTWHNAQARASNQYILGVSYPRNGVQVLPINSAHQSSSNSDFFSSSNLSVVLFLVVLGAGYVGTLVYIDRRNKLHYLPPKISIEGHGIRRGLTAVEAAILMQQPLDKVLTIMLLSAIKKGAARISTRDPLEIAINEHLPGNLNPYDKEFLDAMSGRPNQLGRTLQTMFVRLVRHVSNKMQGFSRQETIQYYKSRSNDAWAQVKEAETPEAICAEFDKNLEWILLDDNYRHRAQQVFTKPILTPAWWSSFDPELGGSARVSPFSKPLNVAASQLSGADFAASLVGSTQLLSTGLLGDIAYFSGGVAEVTNPPVLRSWRGGHGGGCAGCACACAGCACACAGGGR